ncbi:MAG: biotin biosynthesis bifunctional protein BioAB, partial [Coprobacter sp.]|nr:biotin biosynthesis bifunctional protein BioAB [Coprobacter sp.]
GMGETMAQRIELAFKLKELNVCSIPVNILQPIPGTPLENTPPISDEEILTTIAVFRFIHPKAQMRFAGGRARISEEVQLKALEIGVNSAVVGDMLTTVSCKIDEDRTLIEKAGYEF